VVTHHRLKNYRSIYKLSKEVSKSLLRRAAVDTGSLEAIQTSNWDRKEKEKATSSDIGFWIDKKIVHT